VDGSTGLMAVEMGNFFCTLSFTKAEPDLNINMVMGVESWVQCNQQERCAWWRPVPIADPIDSHPCLPR